MGGSKGYPQGTFFTLSNFLYKWKECNACICFSLSIASDPYHTLLSTLFPRLFPPYSLCPQAFLCFTEQLLPWKPDLYLPSEGRNKGTLFLCVLHILQEGESGSEWCKGQDVRLRLCTSTDSVLCHPQAYNSPTSPLNHLSWFLDGEALQGTASYSLVIRPGHGPCHCLHYRLRSPVIAQTERGRQPTLQQTDGSRRFWLLQRPRTLPWMCWVSALWGRHWAIGVGGQRRTQWINSSHLPLLKDAPSQSSSSSLSEDVPRAQAASSTRCNTVGLSEMPPLSWLCSLPASLFPPTGFPASGLLHKPSGVLAGKLLTQASIFWGSQGKTVVSLRSRKRTRK